MKLPLRNRALWAKLVKTQEERMTKQGGDQAGYIAHHHFRLGRNKANAVAKYEADAAVLQAFKRRLAEGHQRPVRTLHTTHA
jgi:hypothetical protein